MTANSYKSILEDSSRNRFMFYYSGTSLCCKMITKDGAARDTIIASQVSDNFFAALDLQDNINVLCINNEQGIFLYSFDGQQWKLEQKLNIQGGGSVTLLSFFIQNGTTHIIYAKQMTIANFYNIYHLYKPSVSYLYQADSVWKKNNISEIYAEDITKAYSAVTAKDGSIHIVGVWFDGSNYLIKYNWLDAGSDSWKSKIITTIFKKDIKTTILYEENNLHLLCCTYEDDMSALFYYTKKEGPGKDFEFNCLNKIKTEASINPIFHIESGYIFITWISDNKFYQYTLNKDQKNWSKKFDNPMKGIEIPQLIEYQRNRKGKAIICKKTYYMIDGKYNINLPYFKENGNEAAMKNNNNQPQSPDGDLIRYIPYILDELKALTENIDALNKRLDRMEGKKRQPQIENQEPIPELPHKEYRTAPVGEPNRLKKSSFKDTFMTSNKLLNRPEAAALFVGANSLPNPENLTKKESIPVVENQASKEEAAKPVIKTEPPIAEADKIENKGEANDAQKDANLFKKIGDFFK